MLKMPKILLIALLLATGLLLAARTAEIRTGKVVCAEVSATAPEIIWSVPGDKPGNCNSPVYAVVMIRVEAGRSFSIVDYELKLNGTVFHAVAAAKNLEPFRSDLATLRPGELDTVKLLFILDQSQCRADGNTSAELISRLPGQPQNTAITFTGIGSRTFTVPAAIPDNGALQ